MLEPTTRYGYKNQDTIKKYWKNNIKGRNMKKIVCYTYISGSYDVLKQHSYISKNWDYVCFTNNIKLLKQKQIGVWEIRHSKFEKLEPKRNSGWHKTHPHILFPNYEKSVWIDSNINVLTNYLEKTLNNTKKKLFVPIHYERDCIYDEITEVKNINYDKKKQCDKTLEFLISENMPKKYGLNETNIMLRYHNDKKIKSIDELWWNCIKNYSKRDQLSFSYCLYKHGIKVKDISFSNARIDKTNYFFNSHNYQEHAKIILPMFVIRIIGLFIFNNQKRRLFRKNHQRNKQ